MSSHNDSFVSSGNAPTFDFLCENHGSIFLLRPVSPSAFSWIEEHLPPDRITFGNAIAVDHRCIWACPSSVDDKHLYRTKLLVQSIRFSYTTEPRDGPPSACEARSVFSSFFPQFNNDEWCIPDCEPRECVHTFHIADTSTNPPHTHTAVGSLLSYIGVWRANISHPSRFRSISSKGSSCPTKNTVLTELVESRRPSL